MIHPRRGPDDLLYYTSPLLEQAQIPHAFSTRQGGVSLPPFHSLNLGISRDSILKDSPAKIEINYHRLATAIGCQNRTRTWVSQVHGRDICEIRPGHIFGKGVAADALITDDPARSLSIKYADCVPILLATPDGRAVAAVHAGWRGLVCGIIGATVRRLELFTQSPASTFIAAIGPCICREHFEVGPEVLTAFDELLNPTAPPKKYTEKGHVDLAQTTHHHLQSAGIPTAHIDTTPLCTYENPAEFYSHRRDGAATGRMAAIISPRPKSTDV